MHRSPTPFALLALFFVPLMVWGCPGSLQLTGAGFDDDDDTSADDDDSSGDDDDAAGADDDATVLTSFSLGGPSPRANGLQTYVTVQLLPSGGRGGGASDSGSGARGVGAAQKAVARHLCRWVAWATKHGSNKLVSFHNASEDGAAEQPCIAVGAGAAGAAGAQLEAGGWRHTSDLNGPMVVLSQALAVS